MKDFSERLQDDTPMIYDGGFGSQLFARGVNLTNSALANGSHPDAVVSVHRAYIDAGADGIMIHSKKNEPTEIIAFCQEFSKFIKKVPLIVVPTTYNMIYEKELQDMGVNLVIYANHMLRSAYLAMVKTANTILKHKRSYEAEKYCLPIKEFINIITEK